MSDKPMTRAELSAAVKKARYEAGLQWEEENRIQTLRGELAVSGVKNPHLLSVDDVEMLAESMRSARELSKMDRALIAEIPRRGRVVTPIPVGYRMWLLVGLLSVVVGLIVGLLS